MAIPARLPVFADVDGVEVELPAGLDPLVLIEAISRGWWAVFRLIDSDDVLARRLASPRDGFGLAQARQLARGMVEAVTGYPFYTASSLAATAVSSWTELDGVAAYRGFDPWSAPAARTLALVHHCLMIGCKDDVGRAYMAYQLAGPEAEEIGNPASPMAAIESSNFAEWAAAFEEDGTLKA